jgi:hypothetical protein
MSGSQNITELINRIRKTLLRERLILFVAGILGTAAGVILVSIILTLTAGIFIIPIWFKITLLILSGLIGIYLFVKLAFARLFHGSDQAAALKLEKKFPQLKGRLIAALQFSTAKEDSIRGYSNALVQATLVQAAKKAANLNFNEVISFYPLMRNLRTLGIGIVVGVLMLVLFPGLFTYSYNVYSHPTELIAPPLGYKLNIFPGSVTAIKYRDVDLGGILQGDKFPDQATIYYRFAGGIWQKMKIDLARKSTVPSSYGDSLLFTMTLRQVRRSLDYYVQAGRVTTPVNHIDIVDRPRVTGIKLSLFYPKYTGLAPTVIDENDGTISAVMGTRAEMKITTNVPVDIARMDYGDSTSSAFEINGLTAEQFFKITEDKNYTIYLVDKQGEVNPDPIEYTITAVPDEYPVIDVIRPGMDINLNDDMMVPLQVRISDDYGFSSLLLKYQHVSGNSKGEENVAVLHFSDRIKTEGEINFNWDVEPLNLMPSDYIRYHFELADNDMISGPKVTVSREYIARLPSLEEIIAQTEAEQGQNIRKAEELLDSHKDLSDRLKNIMRKMEQEKSQNNKNLPWQHQKELEDIAEKDEQMTQELKEMAKNMDKMVNDMEKNRLANREILEKLAEIQKLFEEVATPEMKEARLKMLEALKKMKPEDIEQALKDYQTSKEELMRRLNRTIALLKQMQIEQKVNAMTEMAQELVEKQEKVNSGTESSNAEKLPALESSERKIQKGMESLKKEAENLREMIQKTPFSFDKEAKQFCGAVEGCQAGDNMEKMSQQLAEKRKESALKEGKQARSRLLQLLNTMQQGQAKMCKGGGSELAAKMRDAIDDINYLSDEQEDLIGAASNITGRSEVLRDLAAQEQILKESVGGLSRRIDELGQRSPFIAAELGNLVRNALGNIDLSIDKLSDRSQQQAIGFQREAMYNLNRAAVRMLDALESQKNCNNGGSCNKPGAKMNSMCQNQMQLNQETQKQCQNPNALGGKEALKRLAGEQGAIHKSLQELQAEFGNSREVLGRLDAISEDMQKVVDQLSSGEVGQETLDRQLKIYSRMLDATKTLQRKDFTDERKSTVGQDILRNSPASLSGNQLKGGLDIEDRLRRFLDESYPPEYEQHIKAYFKALLEKVDNATPLPKYENE